MKFLRSFKWSLFTCGLTALVIAVMIMVTIRMFGGVEQTLHLPGEAIFQMDKPGRYHLAMRRYTVIDNAYKTVSTDLSEGAEIWISSETDGSLVPMEFRDHAESAESDESGRFAMASLLIDDPGTYRLHAEGMGNEERTFVIEEATSGTLVLFWVLGLMIPMPLMFLCLIPLVLETIFFFSKRRSSSVGTS